MDLPGGSGRQQPPMTPLPLARQGSIYSLTFDEFQTTLGGAGKDFGSMNMDELLRNIWMAEESHAIAAPAATTSSAAAVDHAAGAPIQRQGSLTLPRTLSQKTVDEVWRDMMCFGTPAAAASRRPNSSRLLGRSRWRSSSCALAWCGRTWRPGRPSRRCLRPCPNLHSRRCCSLRAMRLLLWCLRCRWGMV